MIPSTGPSGGPPGPPNNRLRHLSLDGFRQDQTVVLQHRQDPGGTLAGLAVSDRPEGSLLGGLESLGIPAPVTREEFERALVELPEADREDRVAEFFQSTPRTFAGRTRGGDAALVLHDGQGRPRIILAVPAEGDPYLSLFDEAGDAVANWPEP